MHFSVTSEQQDFFSKQGHIEFEGLVTSDELESLCQALDEVLNKRISQGKKPPTEPFLHGRDCWREHPIVKKIVFSRKIAQPIAQLTRKKTLRIGFDHYFKTPAINPFPQPITSLQDGSCIKPLVCGLLLRLTDGPLASGRTAVTPCPSQAGNGIFISPSLLIEWEPLFRLENQKFLLITYIGNQALYILEKRDPLTHLLKYQGYGFGDHISPATHPKILGD